MPYSDPKKQALALKKARKRYREKHPERDALTQKMAREKRLLERRKKNLERERAAGRKPRPKGPKARTEIILPASRKWRIFTDKDNVTRLYFTSKRGFELSELNAILKEFKSARTRALTQ